MNPLKENFKRDWRELLGLTGLFFFLGPFGQTVVFLTNKPYVLEWAILQYIFWIMLVFTTYIPIVMFRTNFLENFVNGLRATK